MQIARTQKNFFLSFFSCCKVFRENFNQFIKGSMDLTRSTMQTIAGLDTFRDVFVISNENRKLYLVKNFYFFTINFESPKKKELFLILSKYLYLYLKLKCILFAIYFVFVCKR